MNNLVNEVKELIKQGGFSQAKAARLMGISEATFSRWLNGSYPNPENVEPIIEDFLEKNKKREETKTGISNFAETCMSVEIWNALSYYRTQKCIGCIFGDAGIGKTKTLTEWAKDKSDVIIITARPAFSGSKSFAKLLARSLKSRSHGSCDEIYLDIINKLKGTDKMLIIDEAQHLRLRTIEDIRSLNDDPETNTTVVFVGNQLVYRKLKGSQEAEFAQLFSRTIVANSPLVTERFTIDDIHKVFSIADKDANEVLLMISRTKYGLRGAVNVFENAMNNNDISKKGLLIMAKTMGIVFNA